MKNNKSEKGFLLLIMQVKCQHYNTLSLAQTLILFFPRSNTLKKCLNKLTDIVRFTLFWVKIIRLNKCLTTVIS